MRSTRPRPTSRAGWAPGYTQVLSAYFDGYRAGQASGPVPNPDLTGEALLCWLDGYAEGQAEGVDRGLGCPACSGDGCHRCVHVEAAA